MRITDNNVFFGAVNGCFDGLCESTFKYTITTFPDR